MQIHMLSNCPAAVRWGGYSWHHNLILYTMCHYLLQSDNVGCKLHADLNGFKSPTELFNRLIPDIVLVRNNKLTITELMCCFKKILQNQDGIKSIVTKI